MYSDFPNGMANLMFSILDENQGISLSEFRYYLVEFIGLTRTKIYFCSMYCKENFLAKLKILLVHREH